MDRVLIDAGPIIAILSERDRHHRTCVDTLHRLAIPMLTSWPVVTEVTYLLRRRSDLIRAFFAMLNVGLIAVRAFDEDALNWFDTFFQRYADQSPELGDASLIYLAEKEGIDTIFTLDRRDFQVFRRTDGQPLTLLPAESEQRLTSVQRTL